MTVANCFLRSWPKEAFQNTGMGPNKGLGVKEAQSSPHGNPRAPKAPKARTMRNHRDGNPRAPKHQAQKSWEPSNPLKYWSSQESRKSQKSWKSYNPLKYW